MEGVNDHIRDPVGRLEIIEKDSSNRAHYDLAPGKQLIIGRNRAACGPHGLVLDDPYISNRHLKFYSVVHDQQKPSDIDPMVYVEDVSSNGVYWNDSYVGNCHPPILLSEGDLLKICPRFFIRFHSLQRLDRYAFDNTRASELKCFADKFQVFPRRLGKGAQASVHLGLQRSMKRQVACKIVNIQDVGNDVVVRNLPSIPLFEPKPSIQRLGAVDIFHPEPKNQQSEVQRRRSEVLKACVLREVEILKTLDHPNVICLVQVYQAKETLYLFQDLVTGGDLYSYIEYKGGFLHEAEAAVIVRQLLEALKYIHGKDIVHRDVKPDNILIGSLRETAKVMLTDFGSARRIFLSGQSSFQRMDTRVGTIDYCAPEIHDMNRTVKTKGYTKAVDLWSAGCVTAALLTGCSPFASSNVFDTGSTAEEAFLQTAAECDLYRLDNDEEWRSVGHRPKDFVRCLLILDEDARMTASDALDHDWFSNPHHKEVLDALYKKAIGVWKPTLQTTDLIKKIGLQTRKSRFFSSANPPRLRKASKLWTPIEPHYSPCHKNVQRLIYGGRDQDKPSPVKKETSKAGKLSSLPSIARPHRPEAVTRARARKNAQKELPRVEDLSIGETEKRSSEEVVPNSQDETQSQTQLENLVKQQMRLPLRPSKSPSSNGGTQLVLPEHPKVTLATPHCHESQRNNLLPNDAKKIRPRVEAHIPAKLSSVSPLQRKAPKPPKDGPLRSKVAVVVPRWQSPNASGANNQSWVKKLPQDFIAQLTEAASSPPQAGSALPPAESAPSQAEVALPQVGSSSPRQQSAVLSKVTHKRRRVSTVENGEELAIFTEASTQHRHFITVNSLREVIAQKRAKLTHTSTESQLLQMEVDDQEGQHGDEEDEVT